MPAIEPLPAGAIVAGGRGNRLGLGRPKAWADVAGRTLLERALVALGPHVSVTWVAAPAGLELPAGSYRRIDDEAGMAGPLAGLAAALCAIGTGEVLVLGVDYPLVQSEWLAALAAWPSEGRGVVPRVGGRVQPLVARFPARHGPALRRALARGERALVPAVLELDPLLVDEADVRRSDPELLSFINVNTHEDLARVERLLLVRPA